MENPALDLLGELLRCLGEHAFDIDGQRAAEIRGCFEAWARHLLVGAPVPGSEAEGGEGAGIAFAERDWAGARRFLLDHRLRERDAVNRSLGDLREAIWAFIHGLGEAFEDRNSDAALHGQMERIRSAVEGSSTEEIRREVSAAVGVMGHILAERRDQHHEQCAALGARVRELREELAAARERMERDAVTGVYNRAALDEHLARVADLGSLFGESAYLIMVDIDHFKWVNDSFGHPAGDAVLREVAAGFDRLLRRREDFVARYGGDELVVVIGSDPKEGAEALADRLLQAVRDVEVPQEGEPVRVTASIGVAPLEPGEGTAAWLERADRALYRAKQEGRDRARMAPLMEAAAAPA